MDVEAEIVFGFSFLILWADFHSNPMTQICVIDDVTGGAHLHSPIPSDWYIHLSNHTSAYRHFTCTRKVSRDETERHQRVWTRVRFCSRARSQTRTYPWNAILEADTSDIPPEPAKPVPSRLSGIPFSALTSPCLSRVCHADCEMISFDSLLTGTRRQSKVQNQS